MTIFKYAIGITEEISIPMPVGAEILCVQEQRGFPCIWARINERAAMAPRAFQWRGTGHPADGTGRYVGTIQLGALVFHLFEAPTVTA